MDIVVQRAPAMAPNRDRNYVGVIPAAGHATRLSPLPSSKELLVVGLRDVGSRGARPMVVSQHLLENLREGGVRKAYFVVRHGKWDVPAYWGSGSEVGLDLAYVVITESPGVPYTIDAAYPFVRDAHVAFGFPDIICHPPDAFARVRARLEVTEADVVLGVFPVSLPSVCDGVALRGDGTIEDIVVHSPTTAPRLSWCIAMWSPRFTEFLHEHLRRRGDGTDQPELAAGHVLRASLREGFVLHSVVFEDGGYLDIGTPEGLRRALVTEQR
jgi:glucose-1-phosphate thymidylyltransferase